MPAIAGLGQGRVEHAALAELVLQAVGHAEDAPELPDVLAEHERPVVLGERPPQRLVERLRHRDLRHRAPPRSSCRARSGGRSAKTHENSSRAGRGSRARTPSRVRAASVRASPFDVVQERLVRRTVRPKHAQPSFQRVGPAPRLHLGLGLVPRGVVGGRVGRHPVRDGLDQRRPAAAAGALRRFAHGRGRRPARRFRRPARRGTRTPRPCGGSAPPSAWRAAPRSPTGCSGRRRSPARGRRPRSCTPRGSRPGSSRRRRSRRARTPSGRRVARPSRSRRRAAAGWRPARSPSRSGAASGPTCRRATSPGRRRGTRPCRCRGPAPRRAPGRRGRSSRPRRGRRRSRPARPPAPPAAGRRPARPGAAAAVASWSTARVSAISRYSSRASSRVNAERGSGRVRYGRLGARLAHCAAASSRRPRPARSRSSAMRSAAPPGVRFCSRAIRKTVVSVSLDPRHGPARPLRVVAGRARTPRRC